MSNIIIRAAKYAAEAHKGQFRKYNNDPYIFHPSRVAARAAIHPLLDVDDVVVGFLHDVIEDCERYTVERITTDFGALIAEGCVYMTNPSKKVKANRAERKRIDREHWKNAPLNYKLLKMMDRCDNLREFLADAKVVNDPSFLILYANESEALFNEALIGTDTELENEYKNLFVRLRMRGEYFDENEYV
jgi:(p)ppGpp synthase/HD superfamily hydrolase